MSLTKIFSIVIIGLAGFCSSADAQTTIQTLTLDFTDNGIIGNAFDGNVVGTPDSVLVDPMLAPGLTLTATGDAIDPTAVLNADGTGFGVNTPGADDSNGVENIFEEVVSLSFNQDVSIIDVDFSAITDGANSVEAVSLAGTTILGTSLGTGDTFTFSPAVFLPANTVFDFFEVIPPTDIVGASNGVSLQGLTIEVEVSDVPEPGSLVLFGLGSVLMIARRRRS